MGESNIFINGEKMIPLSEAFKFAEWVAYFYQRSEFGEWTNLGFPMICTTQYLYDKFKQENQKK